MKKVVERLAKDEVKNMIIWAFEKNLSCKFYEKIGGKKARKEIINIGGKELVEIGFSWSNLEQLLSEL